MVENEQNNFSIIVESEINRLAQHLIKSSNYPAKVSFYVYCKNAKTKVNFAKQNKALLSK